MFSCWVARERDEAKGGRSEKEFGAILPNRGSVDHRLKLGRHGQGGGDRSPLIRPLSSPARRGYRGAMTTNTVQSNDALTAARAAYDAFRARGLKLNMQRGQPSDADFDLSNGLLTVLDEKNLTMDGHDLRNYVGGVAGLPSARALFAQYLDVKAENVVVWNNSTLR